MLRQAIKFATLVHLIDVRKYNGEPYITHCMRVMHRAIMHPITGTDDKYAIAAVCHDTVEDHPDCEEDFANIFGIENYLAVMHLTNQYTKEAYPQYNRANRKAMEVERLSVCSDPIKVIKMLDRIDNLQSYLQDSLRYRNDFEGRFTEDPTAFGLVYSFESVNLLRAIGDPDPALRDEGLLLCYRMIELANHEGHSLRPKEQDVFESLHHLTENQV